MFTASSKSRDLRVLAAGREGAGTRKAGMPEQVGKVTATNNIYHERSVPQSFRATNSWRGGESQRVLHPRATPNQEMPMDMYRRFTAPNTNF